MRARWERKYVRHLVGLIKPEKMSFARFSTDDTAGKMRGYVGEGRFTDDPLNTFGGAGVVEIPQMQKLLHYICENGFEHHVAANLSTVAPAVYEATTRYLGWDMYWHPADGRLLMAIVAQESILGRSVFAFRSLTASAGCWSLGHRRISSASQARRP